MRVLMATGGSLHSEAALRFGAGIADRTKEPPTVLTVIKQEADRETADAILARAHEVMSPTVEHIRPAVRLGHPAEEILREAEEGGYDLVILGERQHHGLVRRFFLGSTAVRVVHHAPCPVVIAKGKVGPVQRILLCDSGVESPSLLGRIAEQLADLIAPQDEVTILHVMSQISAGPGGGDADLTAAAEALIEDHAPEGRLLERDMRILERLNVRSRPKVRHGLVVDEILEEAVSGDYDLVVIGAYRGEGWRRILLPDLAHEIIGRMDRPILVVR